MFGLFEQQGGGQWQDFVSANFQQAKAKVGRHDLGAIMRELGKMYRAQGLAKTPKKSPVRRRTKSPGPGRGRGPRQRLPTAYHACSGLKEEPCDVAPMCYWQPKSKRCMTRHGKGVTGLAAERASIAGLAAERAKQRATQRQGGLSIRAPPVMEDYGEF